MEEKDDAVKQLAEYYGVSVEELERLRNEVDEELARERAENGEDEDEEECECEWTDCAEKKCDGHREDEEVEEEEDRLSVRTFL